MSARSHDRGQNAAAEEKAARLSARAGFMSDFDNEAPEKAEKIETAALHFSAAEPTRCGSMDLGSLFALAAAPPAHYHPRAVFIYIYSWICFARRGPVWLGRPLTTGPSGRPPGQF